MDPVLKDRFTQAGVPLRLARTPFYWWEIDLTYYGLKLLAWLGIIWDLKPIPAEVRDARPEVAR